MSTNVTSIKPKLVQIEGEAAVGQESIVVADETPMEIRIVCDGKSCFEILHLLEGFEERPSVSLEMAMVAEADARTTEALLSSYEQGYAHGMDEGWKCRKSVLELIDGH
ncbi:hypothetical protein [Nonomuraea jabiensis]|uniref:hypothetical protein n=1 Tax=Nonomuraea jabiensis TaxID=882448 RepID=UPI003696B5FB